ncbi:unnamed protein product [Cyprideis torosa]|uniref:Uncharacterized protein n=1 Tax=Cyprideis torosa TaxID=163714 RepID=A0A7R8WDV8_9CRUS|nr:unnamed protein product [Cyprideis torosa]CAG0889544.1 unnamed protein product [Cyprideis torosa]
MDAGDGRNFRSYYYEKFGLRSVEERRHLEHLLQEKTLDLLKIRTIAIRFPLPAMYRLLVWKVCLGVLPPYPASHEFVLRQRKQQFESLRRGARVMGAPLGEGLTPDSELLIMWLTEEQTLCFDLSSAMSTLDSQRQLSVFRCLLEMFAEAAVEDAVSVYWIGKALMAHLREGLCPALLGPLVEYFHQTLGEHPGTNAHSPGDVDGRLLLSPPPGGPPEVGQGAISLPQYRFYDNSLEAQGPWRTPWREFRIPSTLASHKGVWDKVIGGCFRFFVFVTLALLDRARTPLLRCKTAAETQQALQSAVDTLRRSEDSGEEVTLKAIDLWEKYCNTTPG